MSITEHRKALLGVNKDYIDGVLYSFLELYSLEEAKALTVDYCKAHMHYSPVAVIGYLDGIASDELYGSENRKVN